MGVKTSSCIFTAGRGPRTSSGRRIFPSSTSAPLMISAKSMRATRPAGAATGLAKHTPNLPLGLPCRAVQAACGWSSARCGKGDGPTSSCPAGDTVRMTAKKLPGALTSSPQTARAADLNGMASVIEGCATGCAGGGLTLHDPLQHWPRSTVPCSARRHESGRQPPSPRPNGSSVSRVRGGVFPIRCVAGTTAQVGGLVDEGAALRGRRNSNPGGG